MSRLYGDKEGINSSTVKDFFNDRANKNVESDLSIVLFQDKENSERRNNEENSVFLDNISSENKKILEIGCGIGRWAEFLHDKCHSYLGLDYSENLIDMAKDSHNFDNCHFQVMSAFDIKVDELLVEAPFDIILISQVLMYINDEDLDTLINEVNNIVSKEKQLFITEPISCLDSRLTLKDFYSDELAANYNAIYRTENEYLGFFNKLNCNEIVSNDIFRDLNKRSETQYKNFIIK